MKPVKKPKNINHIGGIDIKSLVEFIERLPNRYWQEESARRDNDYAVFLSTEHIVLRFIEKHK